MIEALKVDLSGNVIGAELVFPDMPDVSDVYEPDPEIEGDLIVVARLVTVKPVPRTYNPIWDNDAGEWAEGLTQEEIDAIKNTPVPKSPLEIRTDLIEVRILGIQDVQGSTLQQTSTIDVRTLGLQDLQDYTLELLNVAQQQIEGHAETIADLSARLAAVEGANKNAVE